MLACLLVCSTACSLIPNYSAAAEFQAAHLVPADAWLFSEMNLRPSLSQLAGTARLADAFNSQPGWNAYVQSLSRNAGESRVDFANDVLPLLDGEVAIAASGSIGASTIPQIVLLAHASDPDQLVRVLEAGQGGTSAPTPTKDAHGANVYAVPGASAATFKGWLVLVSSASGLNDTLDRIAGGATSAGLGDDTRFKNVIGRLPSERLAAEYLDIGAILRAVAPTLSSQRNLPPQTRALLNSFQGQLAMSFAAAPSGLDIRMEGAAVLPPELAAEQQAAAATADPVEAFAHLPSTTLVAFGAGLPGVTPELDDALSAALQQVSDQLQAPELGDLNLHPSAWLGGAFAFGGSAGTIGEPGGQPDVFLVAQVTDPDAAQADVDAVSALLPPKSVTPVTVGGFTMAQTTIQDDHVLTYGLADGWLYGVSGDAESVVDAASSGGLADNPRYATLREALGGDRVNVFVDAQGIRELSTSLLTPSERSVYESTVRPLAAPLTFFGGGSRSEANGDSHGHFVLGIQKP